MEVRSLPDYLDLFLSFGGDCAYAQVSVYRTERWSYRHLAETAFRFARELESRDIGKGDRVLIWGPNSAQWVAAFFGCILRGAVVVPMDDAASPDFARRVTEQVAPKLFLCSREHSAQSGSTPFLRLEDLVDSVASRDAAPVSLPPINNEDVLQVVFTSGTTAEPRGVVISHGNVLANIAPLQREIQKYAKYERFFHPVRFLNLLPLSHLFGQFMGMFLPQLMGGTVVFQSSFKLAEMIATIRRERVSVLVCVPRVLQLLKEKIERDLELEGRVEKFGTRFQSAEGKHFLRRAWIFRSIHRKFGWKFWAFISGGAALDRDTEEFWGRMGFAVIQGYGLTETTSLISVNHPFRLGRGSIGKVLAGREVKLSPEGEILVRGGGLAAGYWNGAELRSVVGEGGWYRTGDIGELDVNGNLYFKGRMKDVIVTPAGMNVYPEDLEAVLRRQSGVKDTVVLALPREGNAEPCAVLILRDGADAESVVRHANEKLAEYQRIRCWSVWPEQDFPRTSTQKPRTSLIREHVLAEQAGENVSGRGVSPLAELIARATSRTPAPLASSAKLEADLNLSSLDRVELLSALEDRYQIDLSETQFASVNTVGDLEKILQGERPPRVQYHYPRWVQRWPVTWIRVAVHYLLLRPAVFLLGWPRVEGRENLRNVRGPLLVICNHTDDVDVGFILTVLPARLRHRLATATGGEALETLRTPAAGKNAVARIYDRLKWTLGVSLLNLFPLPRQAGFRESFAYAGECIDRGYSVLVFPEGRHTADGKMNPFRAGIGLLANSLRVPVLPMRIDGLFEVKRAGRRFARPYQITVKIGHLAMYEPSNDPEWIAQDLQKKVSNL